MALGNFQQLTADDYTVPATEGTAYTAPPDKAVEIHSFWLHNTHTASVTVEIWISVANGASGSAGNKKIKRVLKADQAIEISRKLPWVIPARTSPRTVRVKATSQAGVVSMDITGREET